MGGGDHAGRAEPALQGVMLSERFLQRRKIGVVGESFYRHDLAAVSLHRQHPAGAHGRAIEENGAGPAHAMLASDMGSGEAELVAQAIRKGKSWLDVDLDAFSVDLESRLHRARAALSARSTMVPMSAQR